MLAFSNSPAVRMSPSESAEAQAKNIITQLNSDFFRPQLEFFHNGLRNSPVTWHPGSTKCPLFFPRKSLCAPAG